MLYLDIETLDFFQDPHIKSLPRAEQLAAMRFGLAVTYNSSTDDWREWHGFAIVEMVEYIEAANQPLCGWNIIDFDLPVIEANLRRINAAPTQLEYINVLDIFNRIRTATGRWYSLDVVAQANLHRGKIAHGQQATEWLRSGDPDGIRKTAEYCRDDVELVRQIHEHLERGESLLLPKRAQRNELNDIRWSFKGHEYVVGEDGVLGTR